MIAPMMRDIILAFAVTLVICLTGAALHSGLGGMGGVSGAMQNAVISAIFYTPACAFIGMATCRMFKSPLMLTVLSALAAVVWVTLKTGRASPLKTVQMYGHTLYVDGQATLAGYAYEATTPFTAMALAGVIWMVASMLSGASVLPARSPRPVPQCS